MPCYQVRTVSVEFNTTHKDLLIKAIEKLGWKYAEKNNRIYIEGGPRGGITLDIETQTASFPNLYQREVNRLKRTYTGICIEEAAARKRWALKATGKDKLQMKRY